MTQPRRSTVLAAAFVAAATLLAAPLPLLAAQGSLRVKSKPAGAAVLVNGEKVGVTPWAGKREAGPAGVFVVLEGHQAEFRLVEVTAKKPANVDVVLAKASGTIETVVVPDAAAKVARVKVDGAPYPSGRIGPFKAGSHAVTAIAAGYKPAEVSVLVNDGGSVVARLVMAALPATLVVTTNTPAMCRGPGAAAPAGPGKPAHLEVPGGRMARVVCSADGWEDGVAEVMPSGGESKPVEVELPAWVGPRGGEVRKEEKSGVEFVGLRRGELKAGNFKGEKMKGFWMARTATTTAQYEACVKAGICAVPQQGGTCNWNTANLDHPINCVTWQQARAFCEWIGGRLPTPQEREYAHGSTEGLPFPWGADDPGVRACWTGSGNDRLERGWAGTCPVGSHPAGVSKQGLQDLAGNVWEWLDGEYDGKKETRGGSWGNSGSPGLRADLRTSHDNFSNRVGFRCAQ